MKMSLFRERQPSVSVSLCAKMLRTLVLIYYCCYEITKTSQNELYLLHIHSYKEFTSACNKLWRCTGACIHQSRFYNVTAVSTDSYFKWYLWVGTIKSNRSTWASFLLRLEAGIFSGWHHGPLRLRWRGKFERLCSMKLSRYSHRE